MNSTPNTGARAAVHSAAKRDLAAIACVVTIFTASCAIGPDYQLPDVPRADKFKSATPAETERPALALDWWRMFDDPELNALEDEALQANQNLQAAMARVAQARASAASVKSEFFPVVTMNASASRSGTAGADTSKSTEDKIDEATALVNKVSSLVQKIGSLTQSASTTTGSGSTTATDATSTTSSASTVSSGLGSLLSSASSAGGESQDTVNTTYRIPFDLSYEVDVWGRVRRSNESARAQVAASEYNVQVVRQTLLADVAQHYFNIRALDEQDQILAKNLATYEEQARLTEQKHTAGLINETDVLQARVQLESARADLSDIKRQRANLEHAIAILIGRAPVDFSLPVRTVEVEPPVLPAGLPGDLLRRRPDVAEAEQDLIASSAEIGVAMAEFLPKITLTGSAGFESSDATGLLDWSNRVWSIGPSVSLPIFKGGQLRANLRSARARYDELLAAYRESILTAYVDVEDSLTDLHMRSDQANAQANALNAAREYAHLTRIQYDAGLVDYLYVVSAEQSLLNNELSATSIRNQRLISTVLLIKALGGGWEAPTVGMAQTPNAGTAPKTGDT